MKLQLKSFKDKFKDKSRDKILEEMFEIYKKNEKLEKELKKYKNANTPSSSNKHLKTSTLGLKAKKGAKRGAPLGHKGNTIKFPIVDEIIKVFADKCYNCQSQNIEPTGYIRKKKVICHQKAKIIVKEYWRTEYRCLDCISVFFANHKDIPDKGIYNKSILSLVNYFRFKSRLPHNKIVDVMKNIFEIPMTDPTSLAIINRVAEKCEPEYKKLEEEIKKQEVVHGDETSHSVNGVNHWVWVFCNTFISLFKFNEKRGGDIVERVLGKNFEGKLCVDGWATYKAYSKKNKKVLLQRCWDHGKREVEFECKKKHSDLYRWYLRIYEMTKRGREYKQEKRRHDRFQKCKSELSMWISFANAHTNLRKLATKLDNGGDSWFTCILHPEVPMSNNEAERSLRPFVIMRKIIGCLRTEIGVKTHEIMMSLISTWEKQHKSVFHTLQNTL